MRKTLKKIIYITDITFFPICQMQSIFGFTYSHILEYSLTILNNILKWKLPLHVNFLELKLVTAFCYRQPWDNLPLYLLSFWFFHIFINSPFIKPLLYPQFWVFHLVPVWLFLSPWFLFFIKPHGEMTRKWRHLFQLISVTHMYLEEFTGDHFSVLLLSCHAPGDWYYFLQHCRKRARLLYK